jgi:hypothetical protein
MEEERKMRRVSNRFRKSVIETEFYTKTIGEVEYMVEKEIVFRWGTFDVMLTDAEVEEMKGWEDGHEMNLGDYEFEEVEICDGCSVEYTCPLDSNMDVEEFLIKDANKEGR